MKMKRVAIGVIGVAVVSGLWWLAAASAQRKMPKAGIERKAGALVESIPQIPAYPGAELLGSYKKTGGGKVGWEIEWTTNENVPVVVAWYLQEFPKTGWDPQPPDDINRDGEQQIVASKEGQQVFITVEDEDATGITEITAEFPSR